MDKGTRGVPVRPPGPDEAGRAPAPAVRAREPSWPRVLHTTVTLWWQRRERRGQRIRLAALVVVVLLAAAGGMALARVKPSGHPRPGAADPVLAAQASRAQAAAWVAGQVSRGAIVSCDPVMCSVLQGRGFPASNLDVLGPQAPDPLDSGLVVATNVLRSQFGSRLATVYAPVVLASFGVGSAAVQVRAVAPDGGQAYLGQLAADVAARESFGRQLLRGGLAASPAARRALERGQVDSRLIAVIATMARLHPLRVLSFGAGSPGASPGVPVRSALLTSENAPTRTLASLRSFLTAQQPPYLPAATQIVRLATGQPALSIQFAVPDPLGLLGAGGPVVKIPSGTR